MARATVAPPLTESEAESAEIAANPCASTSFWELVPKVEAIEGMVPFPFCASINDEIPP